MHVVVIGCGRVGSELAVAVEAAGHTVSIIDKDRNAFRHLPDGFRGKAILGFGFDRDHLEEAGIEEAGALAAVTNGDNSNILAARIARETYEIPNVVARIYDPRRAVIYQRLGIQTVATVAWTTDQVLRRLFPDKSVSEWTDASGTISLVERALPAGWAGRKLAELDERDKFRLVALSRAGRARLFSSELLGQEGDMLHLAVHLDALDELEARLTGSATASTSAGHK
ncbi:MAG: trk/ktr system potassium uptake protein [Actinomycetota bacterium]|jgi:trk system potassium uptake protein TrkA|nr:trk/ktr system potassium uptake protein [Actinomycetota bacterium]MEA2842634.1 trk/ktr system potassium uptake protein [Actinomycetota bacterium]